MVKYIFHTSLWSHFSLTNLPSHFILFFVWEQVRGGLQWKEIQTEQLRWKSIQCPWWDKMRDGWYICFCEKWIIINSILPSHLSSLSQSLPLLAFILALVADERGERKKMRWDGWFSSLSHNLPSLSQFSFFRHEGVWIIIIWVQKKASLLPSQV